MSNDLGSLALVIDDPIAPRLVAYWKTHTPALADFAGTKFQQRLAKSCRARDLAALRVTFEDCVSIGLLIDGGISKLAGDWLKATVAQRLGVKPQAPKQPKEPKPAAKTTAQ